MKKDNVTQLPGTSPMVSLKDAVIQMAKDLPSVLEYYKIKAQMDRAYYESLINEGFDKQEALYIVSNRSSV